MFPLLTGGGTTTTMTDLLAMGTEVGAWIIEQMGKFLTFITTNPVVLVMFLVGLVGAGIGFLMRIWHSA